MTTITSEVIAHSISPDGKEIISFENVFPRIILAECNTHRILSKNSASSRAIPVQAMNDHILSDIARPWRFGKKNKGMQDAGEHDVPVFVSGFYHQLIMRGYGTDEAREMATMSPEDAWDFATEFAVSISNDFDQAGYAKQVCNRLTEFAQHMKVIVTGTEFDNFFWLRDHEDADPTIHMLAVTMKEALKNSAPRLLLPGEWHTPYYFDGFWSEKEDGKDVHGYTLQQALRISSSCAAQTSYRKNDDSLEKAEGIFGRLVNGDRMHSSPFEHQATPIDGTNVSSSPQTWPVGVTHMDREGRLWSGNFQGWIQHRKLIMDEYGHDPMYGEGTIAV